MNAADNNQGQGGQVGAIPKRAPGLPPLPLSQTETGALATAPLSTVVNSSTDAVYQDLYNLVHGDVKIVSVAANASGEGDAAITGSTPGGENAAPSAETAAPTDPNAPASTNPNDSVLETRKQKMANLSFAQRRHELTRRIVQHTKSLAHVYSLTAASLPKSYSGIVQQKALNKATKTSTRGNSTLSSSSALLAKLQNDPPPRLGATVQVSSDALQFVKSGWVSQDEAQDALYFHHDGLWKARAHCHDVLGALCVLSTPLDGELSSGSDEKVKKEGEDGDGDAMEVDNNNETSKAKGANNANAKSDIVNVKGGGRWPDFPTDVALAVDRYETSKEKSYSSSELQARLAASVRRKLVLGEVGAFGTLSSASSKSKSTTTDAPKSLVDTTTNNNNNQSGRSQDNKPLPWRVVLGKGGGSVRLTYGTPRTVSTAEALRQQSLAGDVSQDLPGETNTNTNNNNNLQQYPMEAHLSALSEDPAAPWKLLSIHVRCSPKTGESDHQLAMNRKQMFDLHRIGERCMLVEEAVCRKAEEVRLEREKEKEEKEKEGEKENEKDGMTGGESGVADVTMSNIAEHIPIVPRPLHRLFEVTHAFALSLQMEILSSQAEALRRGAWGGSTITVGPTSGRNAGGRNAARGGGDVGECIAVSQAFFFDQKAGAAGGDAGRGARRDGGKPAPIAVMAVHFWSCDDRHGSPRVGDLSAQPSDGSEEDGKGEKMADDASLSIVSKVTANNQRKDHNYLPNSDKQGEKRLSLCIRAVPTVGLVVSLSGGSDVITIDLNKDDISHHTQRNVSKLLSSIQDPFQLSMSDALLAATVLCADRRCRAVVNALTLIKTASQSQSQGQNQSKSSTNAMQQQLPKWIRLEVECGTISVAAVITYPSKNNNDGSTQEERPPTVLFRLACDSRTGKFVPVFPRPASLLRLLACNDPSASDIQALRGAAMASALGRTSNVSKNRVDGASLHSTGRIVRDAFDALSRSSDTLGRKCGVGGEWNDIDAQSTSLREKSIDLTCRDVRVSLMTCCGLGAVFGVGAMALKIAGGVDPVADMAGGPINEGVTTTNPSQIIRVPPLSVLLQQRIVEKIVKEHGDYGETKRTSQLQSELFAVSAKANEDTLELVCFDVLTVSESASAVPIRLEYASIGSPETAKVLPTIAEEDCITQPKKRAKTAKSVGNNSSNCHHTLEEVEHATLWLDTLLRQ